MKTVLIVDDSSAMRKLIKACLKELPDISLEEVASGREAVERLQYGVVDLMTLDLSMPDMDGPAVVAAVRANPACRDMPIIVLTVRNDAPVRAALQEAGIQHYLTKPFQREEIVKLARRLLAGELTAGAPAPGDGGSGSRSADEPKQGE